MLLHLTDNIHNMSVKRAIKVKCSNSDNLFPACSHQYSQ